MSIRNFARVASNGLIGMMLGFIKKLVITTVILSVTAAIFVTSVMYLIYDSAR